MADEPAKANDFDMNRPTIVSLLYLGGFLTGVSALIGLILAYVWKGEPHDGWMESHFRFHIRTFWMGFAWSFAAIVGTILTIGLLGWLLFPLVSIWFVVRTVKALLSAQRHEALADPETWLF